jgi:myosin heavy subunit
LEVDPKACTETKVLLEGLDTLETRLADQIKSVEEETLWLRDVMAVLSDFVPSKSEPESDDTATDDRIPTRAEVMEQLKKILKMFRISVRALHKKVQKFEAKIADYNEQLQERSSAYKILALENSILKSSGKEKDTMTRQVRERMAEENKHLKRTVRRLVDETKRLQQKYEVLEARQEGLRRKKEVATDKNLSSKDALQHMRETSLVVDCIESLVSTDSNLSDRYASLVDPELVME